MSTNNRKIASDLDQIIDSLEIVRKKLLADGYGFSTSYEDEEEARKEKAFRDYKKSTGKASYDRYSRDSELVIKADESNGSYRNEKADGRAGIQQAQIPTVPQSMSLAFWSQFTVKRNEDNSVSILDGQYTLPGDVKRSYDGKVLFVNLPKVSLNNDGILFANLENPAESLEDYVQRRINEREARLQEENRQKAQQQAEKQKLLEEEKKRKAEAERLKAEQERIAAKNKKPTMEEIFNKVRVLRQEQTPYYCTFDEQSKKFSYTSYANAPYLIYDNEKGRRVALPNQTGAFNTAGNLSPKVYRCNEPMVDEGMRMTKECYVNSDNTLTSSGSIEE